MNRNLGKSDKIIRLIIGIVLVTLFFTDTISGTIGIIALVVAGISISTALLNFCGLYKLIGINTCKMKRAKY